MINSGFQLGIKFFFWESFKSINCSATVFELQFLNIPMALASKFRMKKNISDWFSDYPNLPNLRTYPRSQDRLGYAYKCRYESSNRFFVYL